MKTLAYLGVLSVFNGVYGWGELGHETVGFIAMQFLSPKALAFVQSSLGSTYNKSLGPAAPWADDVRSETAYKWSAPFHFVDAQDNPPTSCSVSETRDCASGTCILSAIANYTTRVVETSLSATQRQEALKFLGNIYTGMITKLLAANYSNSVTTWANSLAKRIKTGTFNSAAVSSWISCSNTTEPVAKRSLTIEEDIATLFSKRDIESRAKTPLECPLVWAQDANKFDCSYVFSFKSGTDLCTSSYYTGAVPIIETQIAKGGYRLAAWLNVLFDGATNLP
ncbi:phospholipase C/P1 nuclease domain-containing protein [Mycena pura]|uniref:Phospholipase C/P1 nuclease domain-containing protein n=1 Tax=Mycena pura TaxID=153505 RepID=A0AAD6YE15_9AGAR|nr:phospholipase C/P1 nuclease domain-containing protein [Mycena pura]